MFKSKLELNRTAVIKLSFILAVLAGLSGCRDLSVFFDPAKNAPKKQLKVVKRDKPNLSDEKEEREVDPDSDELVEATDADIPTEPIVSNTSANTNNSTNTNTAEPNADLVKIEQKAKAIVGRWKPADVQENIIFEFTASKNEGETYVGTFNFYVNGDRDEPSKYIVSREKMIKLIQFGKESKIEILVSPDGNSMRFVNQDGEVSNLVRATASPQKQPQNQTEKPRSQVPQKQPKPTVYRPEKHDQD